MKSLPSLQAEKLVGSVPKCAALEKRSTTTKMILDVQVNSQGSPSRYLPKQRMKGELVVADPKVVQVCT